MACSAQTARSAVLPQRDLLACPPFPSSLRTPTHVSLQAFAQAAPPPVLGLDNPCSCFTTNLNGNSFVKLLPGGIYTRGSFYSLKEITHQILGFPELPKGGTE